MLRLRPGDIIRNIKSREPYLVISKGPQGFLVVSLWRRIDPAAVEIILPRAQKLFEPDKDIIDMSKEEADALKKNLPLVEDVA